jgi:beta-phosphoglucomutase
MNPNFAVIFDMDGVLVDSYQAHFESWRVMARRYSLDLTEPEFRRTFGRTSREIIRQLWGDRFDDKEIAEFDAGKEQAYREILERNFPEMPGSGELIGKLHAAGFKLAIGSSGPPENIALVQRKLTNGELITVTVTGKEVKHGKPDPEVFLIAASKLNMPPERCAVIEDAPVGIEAARRAGMIAIGLTGTAPRSVLAERAHLVVDSLNELSPEVFIRIGESS